LLAINDDNNGSHPVKKSSLRGEGRRQLRCEEPPWPEQRSRNGPGNGLRQNLHHAGRIPFSIVQCQRRSCSTSRPLSACFVDLFS